jgi:Zn-dependent peptidase ImmA (M78 family)
VSTWLHAHRTANLAAAQAHGDLDVGPSRFPIDVYGAIERTGVMLMWRRLPRAFGMYVNNPAAQPGILINNQLEPAVQRHTAAHELGHHCLRHGNRIDLDLDPLTTPRRGWTEVEKAAEAFAVWFLMPRRAVAAALALLGLNRPRLPEHVYQLSLLLGTPYRTTVRHLVNIRLAGNQQANSWMAAQPYRIKQRIDPGPRPPSRKPDVWWVDRRMSGVTLQASPGDRFVIDPWGTAVTLHLTGAIDQLTSSDDPAAVGRLVAEVDTAAKGLVEVTVGAPGDPSSWTFRASIEQRRAYFIGRHPSRPSTRPPTGG